MISVTPDFILVLGLVLAGFAIPSVLSANIEGRSPWSGIAMTLLAGGLIVLALKTQPGGYALADIPHVFVRVIARFMP